MSNWNLANIEQLISDQIEEDLHLDYKAAAALGKTDGKRKEITKDVSSFANSAGGTIIYGVSEFQDAAKRHLPEKIDPIKRVDITKEWLEQVISMIQPRIPDVKIHPVTVSDEEQTCLYVVEIPQSKTAHQARDHKYYKRHNFESLPMENYELRDVLNRGTAPVVSCKTSLVLPTYNKKGQLTFELKNEGERIAKDYAVKVKFPTKVNHVTIAFEGAAYIENSEEGSYWVLTLSKDVGSISLFPNSDLLLSRQIDAGTEEILDPETNRELISIKEMTYTLYADEMRPIVSTVDPENAIGDWI